MKVELYERHLHDLRERYRWIHEQNLKQLQKEQRQLHEHHVKLAEAARPDQRTVDVRA